MTDGELQRKAVAAIEGRVAADGPPEPRVIAERSAAEWQADLLRTLVEHELHVLGRAADIIVYFDDGGNVTGWRDDGRKGTERPAVVAKDMFLKSMIEQLGLPGDTLLGRLRQAQLPPLGWTHEAVLFVASAPEPQHILRVWASPERLRIIQCLYGPAPSAGRQP